MNEIANRFYGYGRGIWRRRSLALAVAWITAVAAWIVILALPSRYEASARVFVDARTALGSVLEGIAIEDDYAAQLALVREALLSRPQLEAVARKTNLDAGVDSPAAMDSLVSALQKQIKVESSAPRANDQGAGSTSQTIYAISYQHPSREKSVEVVRTLLDDFVEGTLSGNRMGTTAAQDFLGKQIAELEQRLQQSEQKLAEFKKRNIGLTPGERGDYFTRLEAEMRGLQEAETQLAVAVSRRAELQRQLGNARAYLPAAGGNAANAGPGVPPDVTLRRQEAEQRLEELLLRFTDRHPEVIALRETIAELKDRETRELAELERGGPGTGAIRSLSLNPVYQQIQQQLSQAQVEIASIDGKAAQHRREIANLRKVVDQAPEIEQEFARLNRDYGVTKAQYDQLVARREQARVSDDAAQTGIARPAVIEPPRAAPDPVWPKRSALVILSLVFALGLGLAAALLPQLVAPTFDDTRTLAARLGLPVIGAVSIVRDAAAIAEERVQVRRVAVAVSALIALGCVVAAFGATGANLLHAMIS